MITTIVNSLGLFVDIISWVIIIRCFLSWLPVDRRNPIVGFIYRFTEPILKPVRIMVSKSPLGEGMPIDFSPIIAFFIIEALYRIVASILLGFA